MVAVARKLLGALLLIVGVIGVPVALLGLIDPVGLKLADDGDPFGTPDPWYIAAAILCAYAGSAALGLWLLFRNGMPKPRPPNQRSAGGR